MDLLVISWWTMERSKVYVCRCGRVKEAAEKLAETLELASAGIHAVAVLPSAAAVIPDVNVNHAVVDLLA
jgi:hypothetical protein